MSVMSPGRLGSTSAAIQTETKTTPWLNDFTVIGTIGRYVQRTLKKNVLLVAVFYIAVTCRYELLRDKDLNVISFHSPFYFGVYVTATID